jgi:hypothetical protein
VPRKSYFMRVKNIIFSNDSGNLAKISRPKIQMPRRVPRNFVSLNIPYQNHTGFHPAVVRIRGPNRRLE